MGSSPKLRCMDTEFESASIHQLVFIRNNETETKKYINRLLSGILPSNDQMGISNSTIKTQNNKYSSKMERFIKTNQRQNFIENEEFLLLCLYINLDLNKLESKIMSEEEIIEGIKNKTETLSLQDRKDLEQRIKNLELDKVNLEKIKEMASHFEQDLKIIRSSRR